MSREGAFAVCASHAKAALFASGFVRKPRQSSTMPAFSFLPDVKKSFFSSQIFSVSSGFSLRFVPCPVVQGMVFLNQF